MADLRLFQSIDGVSVEVVYIVGTSDVFTDEGLTGLYSRLLGVPVRGEIRGGGVGCGRYDGPCRWGGRAAIRGDGCKE